MISRRGLIKVGAASVGSLALRPFGLLPALAQSGSSDYRALVCVFLFGGNDANNMVIPADDTNIQAYTAIRGQLALSSAQITSPVYSRSTGAPYVFHSDLAPLASLFSSGELAVVANVGSLVQPTTRTQYQNQTSPIPVNLFSHSDQQRQWQTSNPTGLGATGWAGRAADRVAAQNLSNFPTFLSVAGNTLLGIGSLHQPVAISPGGSLDLAGFSTTTASQTRKAALQNLLTMNTGVKLAQSANGVVSDSLADAQALDSALSRSSTLATRFPTTSLGAQLAQVAQIIKVREGLGMRRQIFFCSLGGFDTHANELATLKTLYPQLANALLAFNSAMTELGTQTQVTAFTESDFSRTFQPTSNDGSDHAWGSHHLVMGGAVKGGEIYGSFPTFALGGPSDTDSRGRWIPTTAIDQYGASLCSWFGVDEKDLSAVFPNFANFGSKKIAIFG